MKRRLHLLYIGVCELVDEQVGQKFVELPDGWNLDTNFSGKLVERVFKKIVNGIAGNVYELDEEVKDGKSAGIFVASVRWMCVWHQEDKVAQWQAESDVVRITLENKKRGKKQEKRRLYLERLEPIRKVMAHLPAPEKTLLVFKVIQALHSKVPLIGTDDGDEDD